MAENTLTMISDESFIFLHNLLLANFSYNNLTLSTTTSDTDYYTTESPFASCILLEKLYLSHNRISEIFSDWVITLENLEILDLKNNYISHLSVSIFKITDKSNRCV